MLPPETPVMTTPLLRVVGMRATIMSPMRRPSERGAALKARAVSGDTTKMTVRAERVAAASVSPLFKRRASSPSPESRKIEKITPSGP